MKNRWLKRAGLFLLLLLFMVIMLVGGYVAYLFATYERIEDNLELEVYHTTASEHKEMTCGEIYTVLTYNIGFGAYSADYSFFMDGGRYSRAFSKEAVLENTRGAAEAAMSCSPDIVVMQEMDLDSTRSYHVNQYEIMSDYFAEYSSNFGVNYHSKYLMVPLKEPHGASVSGLATFSRYHMTSALRRSLPISTDVMKFVDLDRAYVITRLPVENGKELAVYNVHLSAYTSDLTIVTQQISMLHDDMEQDLANGNYVLCGGDFNQDMLGNSPEIYHTMEMDASWANPFPKELLPEGMIIVYDLLPDQERENKAPSCRNADMPYVEGENFVTMVDGFIISKNIELIQIDTLNTEFAYSDHNPVWMQFQLK